eukprot:6420120-Pyramimonas_sp.AAC.1
MGGTTLLPLYRYDTVCKTCPGLACLKSDQSAERNRRVTSYTKSLLVTSRGTVHVEYSRGTASRGALEYSVHNYSIVLENWFLWVLPRQYSWRGCAHATPNARFALDTLELVSGGAVDVRVELVPHHRAHPEGGHVRAAADQRAHSPVQPRGGTPHGDDRLLPLLRVEDRAA